MQSETVRDLFDNLKHKPASNRDITTAFPNPGYSSAHRATPRSTTCWSVSCFEDFRVTEHGVSPQRHPRGRRGRHGGDKVMSVYAGGKVEALM